MTRDNICGCPLPPNIDQHVCNAWCRPPVHVLITYTCIPIEDMEIAKRKLRNSMSNLGYCEHIRKARVLSMRYAPEAKKPSEEYPIGFAADGPSTKKYQYPYICEIDFAGESHD